MPSGNGNSRQSQYDRIKRRVDRFTPVLEYARLLKEAAQEILAENPIGSEGRSSEIEESIKALLPPPQIVFTREYFSQPVFPVTLIKDVAALYGCLQVDERILMEVDDEKKADSLAMANVWLAHAYNPTLERVLLVLDMYETARIFGPLSLTMPLTPRPVKEKERLQVPDADQPPHSSGPVPTQVRNAPTSSEPILSSATMPGGFQNTICPRAQHRETNGQGVRDVPMEPDSSSNPRGSPEYSRQVGDPTKKATAVEQYFRGAKYCGDLAHSLQNTIRDYNVCAMQLELTARQKALFFINVFSGTARDYFFEHCRENMSYEQLVDVMKKGFDNNARQLAIEAELENLTLDKVMKDNDISDINQGLTKLADRINSLFPQMPIQSQYPSNKVRFLRKAVIDQDWAKPSIAQIVTAGFGFDDLLTSLREQYQLEREVQEAKNKTSSALSTLYQQYGRKPPKFIRRGTRSSRSNLVQQRRLNPIGRDGKRMACSLCGSHEHFARECPPRALRSSVRSKLENGIAAVHICHDLLKGIEELTSDVAPDSGDEAAQNGHSCSDVPPSELHIFDKLSGEDVLNDEETMTESAETSFFEKVDESIAMNFISSKFTENDIISLPQPIASVKTSETDFQTDV